jgi:carboxylesterase type B
LVPVNLPSNNHRIVFYKLAIDSNTTFEVVTMPLFLILAIYLVSAYAADDGLLVATEQGMIQGYINVGGARQWKGIPYAQPPVGSLRWEYPLPAEKFSSSVYVANVDVAGCPQHCKLPPGNCPEYGTSEDCLYLSVFSPAEPSEDKDGYPVLFWMHGGAYEQGLGNCALYDGTNFAQKGVVSVIINYRLGALGFMASESMQGNYGFMDQRLAMQWTQSNIKGFGGDPNRVTIAGQSAGAMSVSTHLTSPKSNGLFQQAIQESNPLALPYHSRESAAANADSAFIYLNCPVDDVECMRTKTPEEVLDAQDNSVKLDLKNLLLNFLPFAPMVEEDGEIPMQTLTAMQEGKIPAMPMLQGTMTDEGQLFVYELFTKPLSEKEYKVVVEGVFGATNGREILSMYPFKTTPENNTDGRDTLNVLATDLIFYCPLRNVTQGYSAALPDAQSYVYRFKHVLSFDCWGPDYAFCVGTVCHGSDLPFVFNVFSDGTITYDPTAEERQLSEDMANAWSNFISIGNPNKGSLSVPLDYPLYQTKYDELIVLDEPDMSHATHVRDAYCDMWDRMGYFY